MRGWRGLAVLLVLLLSASTSFAAGFRLPEAGVKAMGMGFAFTAQADDPSAIYFNPAGLTQLQGNNIMLGVTYVKENGGEFTGTTPIQPTPISETQKDLNFFIPNLYYTYTEKSGWVSYGVGVFSPFGLGQEYQNANTSIFRNQITKIDLMTVVVNPTIAFKIVEGLSVGFGVDFMYGKAQLKGTPVNPAIGDANGNLYNQELKADATAWGYNGGILLTPTKDLKIGANFRSPFKLEFKDGDIVLTNISQVNRIGFAGPGAPGTNNLSTNAFGGAITYSGKGSTKLNLPATAALGIAYTFGRLTVEADADWTFWSSYQSLTIQRPTVTATVFVPPPAPPGTTTSVPVLRTTTSAKEWEDVVALRFGAEYRVTDPLAIRVGFVYDPTPVPAETLAPELPDATRLNYMLGVGYKVGNWTFDVAGMYIDKKDRTVSNIRTEDGSQVGQNGTWKGDAWLAGLDIGYKF